MKKTWGYDQKTSRKLMEFDGTIWHIDTYVVPLFLGGMERHGCQVWNCCAPPQGWCCWCNVPFRNGCLLDLGDTAGAPTCKTTSMEINYLYIHDTYQHMCILYTVYRMDSPTCRPQWNDQPGGGGWGGCILRTCHGWQPFQRLIFHSVLLNICKKCLS